MIIFYQKVYFALSFAIYASLYKIDVNRQTIIGCIRQSASTKSGGGGSVSDMQKNITSTGVRAALIFFPNLSSSLLLPL
uniref:Uncharacterized protein n=1 Tax=Escherichia coli TaxID=562 RepID=A0A0E3KIH1_ECOLX|nr:hypothetical protein [Escherichia coli]